LLNPLETPSVDVELLTRETNSSFLAGSYLYRVSAVFDGANANNPNGESLPGDGITVAFPAQAIKTLNLVLVLTWDTVPLAAGYRLYRTPLPGGTVQDLRLLAVVTNRTSYEDDGWYNATLTEQPLPSGSLGKWHSIGSALGTPRFLHAVQVAKKPNTLNDWIIYAIGGQSGTAAATYLNTIEKCTVSVFPPVGKLASESQTMGSWSSASQALPSVLTGIAGFVGTSQNFHAGFNNDSWIFTGSARDGANSWTPGVRAYKVQANGDLGNPTATFSTPGSGEDGTCLYGSGGYMFQMAGGRQISQASNSGSSEIFTVAANAPTAGTFNSLGGSNVLPAARKHGGCAQENSLFYWVGGVDQGSNVQQTVFTAPS